MKVIDLRIAIVGLGYIGLPLAVEFGRKHNVIGFDINKKELRSLIRCRYYIGVKF